MLCRTLLKQNGGPIIGNFCNVVGSLGYRRLGWPVQLVKVLQDVSLKFFVVERSLQGFKMLSGGRSSRI